jgi:hypothetical protein
MTPLNDLKEVLNALYKFNDWLNFYWNFYVAFSGVVIGWVFNSKGWLTGQRVIVSIFYLGFVAVSLDALWGTYTSLNAVTVKLQQLAPKDDILANALRSQLSNSDMPLGLALHVLGDILVVVCIWRFAKQPPETNTTSSNAPNNSSAVQRS